ncbi:MAG TPA: helix-turn-helix domain-containing protein [Tepidisphaeraceae bacterium]|nr:helix-turn-helix domain-containing protein [Tepidisphaeraceae bacterium]
MKTRRAELVRDTYLELVRRFPLRRLKSHSQHRAAMVFFTRTSLQHQNAHDQGILDYLELLAKIIDEYEREARLKLDLSHVNPAGLLRQLMTERGLSISGLAREIGLGQSNLSEMLSGRREFSKSAIECLCERFGLNPAVFFRSECSRK